MGGSRPREGLLPALAAWAGVASAGNGSKGWAVGARVHVWGWQGVGWGAGSLAPGLSPTFLQQVPFPDPHTDLLPPEAATPACPLVTPVTTLTSPSQGHSGCPK